MLGAKEPNRRTRFLWARLRVVFAFMLVHCCCQLVAQPGDRVVPGRFLIDPPTLENLGFRWYVEGDANRNASVSVSYRLKGGTSWTEAQPMLRVHHEVVNQAYTPHRTGNLFAGSVMFLEAGAE